VLFLGVSLTDDLPIIPPVPPAAIETDVATIKTTAHQGDDPLISGEGVVVR